MIIAHDEISMDIAFIAIKCNVLVQGSFVAIAIINRG